MDEFSNGTKIFAPKDNPGTIKRAWIGLTDEEIQVLADPCKQPLVFRFSEYARAIEAKLKEKNT